MPASSKETAGFAKLLATYGIDVRQRISFESSEAQLTVPMAGLLEGAGLLVSLNVTADREVSELDGKVRPDFAVRASGLLVGHVELKAPKTSLDPSTYAPNSHNGKQWQKLRELPNLLHTNGHEFRLWRFGEPVEDPVHVHASDLATFKGELSAPARLEAVINNFLNWNPPTISTISRLVAVLAPLARLLREEVHDSLRQERKAKDGGADPTALPFTGVAKDWRRLLMPQATPEQFADGFAQTVVFALLLALDEGIDLGANTLADVGKALEAHHTLMGRALNLLTEHVSKSGTGSAIETIVRVLSATRWDLLQSNGEDLYLHLYEDFLATYDPVKRRESGSYYTPVPVVDSMVRLVNMSLVQFMNRPDGLRDPNVSIIDPAMGTGTYPLSILRLVGQAAQDQYGPGARPEAVTSALARLYGIEIQSGPFSVAELRVTSAVQDLGAAFPKKGLNLFVADTLEDPFSGSDSQLSYTLQLIAQQRQRANQVKRERNIQVCIGNPPYKDHAGGLGGWIEKGNDPRSGSPVMAPFRLAGNGKHERHLSNLYAYFWRWATWKVFESTSDPQEPTASDGVVCFITATGYLSGPGFKGMREYLRRTCSNGWIINVTPEGKQPPQGSAVFNIETPVAIGLFLRAPGTDSNTPAQIKYLAIHGSRAQKFQALGEIHLSGEAWQSTRTDWTAPFMPAPLTDWDQHPATEDLLPWRQNGVMAGRGWVYAPSTEVLELRLRDLINEDDQELKNKLFKSGRDASLSKPKKPLKGADTEQATEQPFSSIPVFAGAHYVRCGFRALDRQWLIADSRVLSQPSPRLWEARIPAQVFAIELHSEYPKSGPGLVYSSLIPDVHHFRGSGGGRTLPKFYADSEPNIATGLQEALSSHFARPVAASEVFDYVAGIAGHPAYLDAYESELTTPGVRIPVSAEPNLWDEAVHLGRHIQWLHTYGVAGAHPEGFQDVRDPGLGVTHPQYLTPVGPGMPTDYFWDKSAQSLHVGSGIWTHVSEDAITYTIGGTNVLNSWLDFRLATPKKRITSELDTINATQWDAAWSLELSQLLSVLTQLSAITDQGADLLTRVQTAPVLTKEHLSAKGVRWPKSEHDHAARSALHEGLFEV